jgi:hypothetical protein
MFQRWFPPSLPAFWLLLLLLIFPGCLSKHPEASGTPPEPVAVPAPIVINLGASLREVMTGLGLPTRGPLYNRYSNTQELVYEYNHPAIKAITLRNKKVERDLVVKEVHLFFDSRDLLSHISVEPNRHYSWFSGMPVHRIIVGSNLQARR